MLYNIYNTPDINEMHIYVYIYTHMYIYVSGQFYLHQSL